MDKELRKRLLTWTAYGAFFIVCFVTFCYVTFPYDRLKDYLVRQVAKNQQDPGGEPSWKLSIGELGPSPLVGLSLANVEITKPGEEEDDPDQRIVIDELSLNASLFSLIGDGKSFDFAATVGDGDLDGSYSVEGPEGPTSIAAELDEVDIGRLGLGAMLGLPLEGVGSGEIDFTLAKQSAATVGDVELQIADLKIGDGKAKVPLPGMSAGLTLDTVRAGTLKLKLAIKEGVATIEDLAAKGEDLELSGSGSLRLMEPLSRSRPDVTLSVRFDDAYKNKSPRTKAAFDLMMNNPRIKRALSPDGALRFKLLGTVDNMRATPVGPSAARAGPRRPD